MNPRADNLLVKIAALLLIAAQFGLLAHAAEHGAAAHEHDGVVCDLAWNEDDNLVPVATAPRTVVRVEPAAATPIPEAPAPGLRRLALRPPQTGPPR